jgi:autotransporter-associated beta strand protein
VWTPKYVRNFRGCFERPASLNLGASQLKLDMPMPASFPKHPANQYHMKTLSRLAAGLCWLLLCFTVPAQAATYGICGTPDEYSCMGSLDSINAAAAYSLGFTGQGVTVAIIDGGARPTHLEFRDKSSYPVIYWGSTDNENHGTHVAGTVAASKNNIGMHGVAFDATLVSLVSIGVEEDGSQQTSAILKLLDYPEVKVVNNSWGSTADFLNIYNYLDLPDDQEQLYDRTYDIGQAIGQVLEQQDVLFVFAAGNEGHTSPNLPAGINGFFSGTTFVVDSTSVFDPTDIIDPTDIYNLTAQDPDLGQAIGNNIITVLNFDPYALKTWGTGSIAFINPTSNLADGVMSTSILAPGTDIYSTLAGPEDAEGNQLAYANDSYGLKSGTSMAAPHVTGAAALVSQAFPYMGGKQIGDVLLSTADSLDINTAPPFIIQLFNVSGSDDPPYLHITTHDDITVANLDLDDYYEDQLKRVFQNVLGMNADDNASLFTGFKAKVRSILDGPDLVSLDPDEYLSLFGVGILDAGKAVQGPGYLDANRLSDNDLCEYNGAPYAMYTVDSKGYDSTFSNNIGEQRVDDTDHPLDDLPVGLRKSGEGTLYLTGVNFGPDAYQGPTVVDGGILSLGKYEISPTTPPATVGNVYVELGGTFAGNGLVNGDVNSSGTLRPGLLDQAGTELSVNGEVEHVGQYQILLSSREETKNKANWLNGAGDISLSGGVSLVGESGRAISPYQHFPDPVVIANGTLTVYNSSFFDMQEHSAFIKYKLRRGDTDDDELFLDMQTEPLTSLPGLDWRNESLAAALERRYQELSGQAGQPDLNYLYSSSPAGFKNAVNELRGDMQASTLLNPALAGAFKSQMLLSPIEPDRAPAAGSAGPERCQWVQPLFSYSSFEGNQSQHSLGMARFGFASGLEAGADLEGLSVGLMGGYAHSRLEQGSNYADTDELGLSAYGKFKHAPWQLNGYVWGGYQHYNTKRALNTEDGGYQLKSAFNGYTLGAGFNASYNLLEDAGFAVRPYAGADIYHLWQDSREESGHRTFALDVEAFDFTRATLNTGLVFENISPDGGEMSLLLGYSYAAHGLNPKLDASFLGGNTMFIIPSLDEDRHLFNLGLSGGTPLTESVDLKASLLGQVGKNSYSVGGSLAFIWQW